MTEPERRQGLPRRETLAALASCTLLLALPIASACTWAPAPVEHGLPSPDALAEAVVDAMARGDRARLRALALDESEFARLVWPELPASRPGRNLPLDYVWGDLQQKSDAALARALASVAGRRLRLERLDFTGQTTRYDTFVVHRDSRLVVADEDGARHDLRLFGSVYGDRAGRFKVFSYVVD